MESFALDQEFGFYRWLREVISQNTLPVVVGKLITVRRGCTASGEKL
jgi:hypothetical protein